MDYDLFDWAMSIPINLRTPDAGLYRALICEKFPEVSKIPWDTTGNPLNLGRAYQKNDLRINKNYFLLHILRRLSLGKIDLINAYSSNNRLFRTNKKFRDANFNLLNNLNEDSKNLFSNKGIMKLIKMILHGRDYYDILQRVITLKTFFDNQKIHK